MKSLSQMLIPSLLKRLWCIALILVSNGALFGASVQLSTFDTFSGAEALGIPDGNYSGAVDIRTVSFGDPGSVISSVRVGLNISGDFNGDLYGYLSYGTELSVLLNRPGLSASNSDGYFDSGLDILLSEGAPSGIHSYQNTTTPAVGAALTGEWIPDGRNIHPESSGASFDAATRNAGLDSFNGLAANGDWSLFLADVSSGGEVTLESWSLEITVVPEPKLYALICGLFLVVLSVCRRIMRQANSLA